MLSKFVGLGSYTLALSPGFFGGTMEKMPGTQCLHTLECTEFLLATSAHTSECSENVWYFTEKLVSKSLCSYRITKCAISVCILILVYSQNKGGH